MLTQTLHDSVARDYLRLLSKPEKAFLDALIDLTFGRGSTGVKGTLVEIAKGLGVSPATASRLLARFDALGLLTQGGAAGGGERAVTLYALPIIYLGTSTARAARVRKLKGVQKTAMVAWRQSQTTLTRREPLVAPQSTADCEKLHAISILHLIENLEKNAPQRVVQPREWSEHAIWAPFSAIFQKFDPVLQNPSRAQARAPAIQNPLLLNTSYLISESSESKNLLALLAQGVDSEIKFSISGQEVILPIRISLREGVNPCSATQGDHPPPKAPLPPPAPAAPPRAAAAVVAKHTTPASGSKPKAKPVALPKVRPPSRAKADYQHPMRTAWEAAFARHFGDDKFAPPLTWGGQDQGKANAYVRRLGEAEGVALIEWVCANWKRIRNVHLSWMTQRAAPEFPNFGLVASFVDKLLGYRATDQKTEDRVKRAWSGDRAAKQEIADRSLTSRKTMVNQEDESQRRPKPPRESIEARNEAYRQRLVAEGQERMRERQAEQPAAAPAGDDTFDRLRRMASESSGDAHNDEAARRLLELVEGRRGI